MVLPTMLATTNMSMPSCLASAEARGGGGGGRAYLPSAPLVRRPSLVVNVLFFFEEVRLALQRQADALDAGRGEADDDAQLASELSALCRLGTGEGGLTHSDARAG